MKGVALGEIIQTEADIIVQKTMILIHLRKEVIVAINMVQIVQGIQAAALIVANEGDDVEPIMTQIQSNPLHGQD
ncbi:MAG: Uncharacterised protein [Methanobacteriota archaeon]|nr:MAG: Uncharacterised protein [Euryarchaeota archaeon]